MENTEKKLIVGINIGNVDEVEVLMSLSNAVIMTVMKTNIEIMIKTALLSLLSLNIIMRKLK